MRVFNLTDIATRVLEKHRLVQQAFVVGELMLPPGEVVDVPDSPTMRRRLEHLVSVDALAIDQLPPSYVAAKAKLVTRSEPPPAPAEVTGGSEGALDPDSSVKRAKRKHPE